MKFGCKNALERGNRQFNRFKLAVLLTFQSFNDGLLGFAADLVDALTIKTVVGDTNQLLGIAFNGLKRILALQLLHIAHAFAQPNGNNQCHGKA